MTNEERARRERQAIMDRLEWRLSRPKVSLFQLNPNHKPPRTAGEEKKSMIPESAEPWLPPQEEIDLILSMDEFELAALGAMEEKGSDARAEFLDEIRRRRARNSGRKQG